MIRCLPSWLRNWRRRGSERTPSSKPKTFASSASSREEGLGVQGSLLWQFPEELAYANFQPCIVLWSRTIKQVANLDLTVHWEERIDDAQVQVGKISVPQPTEGMESLEPPVEVGCRGFPGQSLWRALGVLWVRGPACKKLFIDTR